LGKPTVATNTIDNIDKLRIRIFLLLSTFSVY